MMYNEYKFHEFVFQIIFDPLRELFFCGIPGYEMPTIYVGKTEEEVQEYVQNLLKNPVDFYEGEGHRDETQISYDAEEAYCTGWILRENGAIRRTTSIEAQKRRHLENERIKAILKSIEEDSPDEAHVLKLEWDKLEEQLGDKEEEKQYSRMRLIGDAAESGHSLCKGDGVDIMKVVRLGIEKSA